MFVNLFEWFANEICRFVSSAKWCAELNSTALCRSLINKIKRRSPSTDSWGTPYLICFFADLLPWTLVNCFLSSRKDWNHILATPLTPWWVIFFKRIKWFTVSNTFSKSRYTQQANWPLSKACLIFSMISIRAWVVEWLFLNSNCFS